MTELELRGLSLEINGNPVLEEISFSVGAGEIFVITGPAASGKSSLLKCIFGGQKPSRGSVCFDGCDITETPPSQRDMALLTQNLALFSHLSLKKNIMMGGKRADDEVGLDAWFDDLFVCLGLTECVDLKPHQLSASQQQRGAIARTLSSGASTLLLDEPFAHADATLIEQLWDILSELRNGLGVRVILYILSN